MGKDMRLATLRQTNFIIKTISKAKEYYKGVTDNDLPINIDMSKTEDGRVRYVIYNKNNELLHKRG
jgi:hypothetical protein